jgi:hypothetical protein
MRTIGKGIWDIIDKSVPVDFYYQSVEPCLVDAGRADARNMEMLGISKISFPYFKDGIIY